MRRWNGWGDEANGYELKPDAVQFLKGRIGPGTPLADASLPEVLDRVPPSRLPQHPLVSTDAEDRLRHARGQSLPDWLAMRSGRFERFPDGVCFAESRGMIRDLLAAARENDWVVIPYGGGTSVVGHINTPDSDRPVVVLSLERMTRLLALDTESQIATFEPGVAGPEVEAQLNARGYTLGHFPQSFELSTLGGWVASRSSGQQSMRYGRIEQLFAGGKLETFAGTLEIPAVPASSAGPDIREMILGSEGRLGVISEVQVRVTPLPAMEQFHVAFLPHWQAALDCVRHIVQQKVPLSMLRLSNATETDTHLRLAASEKVLNWLKRYLRLRGLGEQACMVTFGVTGTRQQVRQALRQVLPIIRRFDGQNTGTLLGKRWEHARFRSPYLRHGLWEQGYAVDTLETAVNWRNVTDTMQSVEEALREGLAGEGERVHVFTHLSHLYAQGSSIYTTYVFRAADSYEATLARWQTLKKRASDRIVAHGGTISHQHGVGKDHAPWLPAEKGEQGMQLIRALTRELDPAGQLAPGNLFGDASEIEN